MKISPNIGLNVPEGSDIFNHETFLAQNFEKIDGYLMNATDVSTNFDAVNSQIEQIAINVKAFGAKGDGVTDDTSNIQAAIDSVTKGMVYFPPNYTFLAGVLTINNPDVVLYLNNCTLKANAIMVNGARSGITGQNAKINGRLKVAKTTAITANGGTVLTFANHPFIVGDGIQSSYGLGGDGSNPITVTATTATTVTVATPVSSSIPIGAYVGTYGWNNTVALVGADSFCKNVDIVESKGYALNAKAPNADVYVDNVKIYNNGLDTMTAGDGVRFHISNSSIGFIYDAAKQGLSAGSNAKVYLNNVRFERDNFDPDFFIYGTHTETEIYANGCIFIGTSKGTHPAPYQGNGWAVIDLNPNEGSSVSNIRFKDCKLYDYSQGIITRPAGATTNTILGRVRIENCEVFGSVPSSDMRKTTWGEYLIKNCLFDGQSKLTNASEWLQNDDKIVIEDCIILNDSTNKNLNNVTLRRNIFDHSPVYLRETSYGEYNTFIESKVGGSPSNDNATFLRLKGSTFKHSTFTTDGNLENNVINLLPSQNSIIDFKFLNGTLSGFLYSDPNYHTKYYLVVKTVGDITNGLNLLYGDDWYIPPNSKIENILDTNATRVKYVSRSAITTLASTGVTGATTLTLTTVAGFNVGDYINIQLDNGKVHTTKFASYPGGNQITLQDALPSQASIGKNICDFLY